MISVRSLKYLRSGVSRSSRPQIKASGFSTAFDFSFKRAAFLFLGAVLLAGSSIVPRPSHIVYADPIIHSVEIKPLQTIKMPSLAAQEPLQAVFVSKLRDYGTYPNDYAPGNCTYYVASRLPVPNSMGNAIGWADALGNLGYTVSDVPKVGAIAVSTTDYYLGHVAIVESVDGGVVVSEMNYNGLGVIDSRPANPGEFVYVYI